MKMNILNARSTLLIIAIVFASLGFWSYTQAAGIEIKACVNTAGAVYVIGDGFKKTVCAKGEQLISWNSVGPKGDKGDTGSPGINGTNGTNGVDGTLGAQGLKGDKGDPGASAQHGAGNIAFFYHDKLLKTDGTVWVAGVNPGNVPPYTLIDGINFSGVTNVPVPVSDIVDWQYSSLIDKNGNYWFINIGNVQGRWHNFGPLP